MEGGWPVANFSQDRQYNSVWVKACLSLITRTEVPMSKALNLNHSGGAVQ